MQLRPPLGTASLLLPCGACIGCRQARAREWARRCCHEAALYQDNVFVTLTYDDEHVPHDGSLIPEDLQKFIKRLRKAALESPHVVSEGPRVRFLACGEYGERSGRPHYHGLFFNVAFSDKHLVGKDLYASDTLSRLWPFGEHKIGEVNARTAAYVAKYNLKRSRNVCDQDGVVLEKPFLRMSRRPGIGMHWLERYAEDLRNGFLVADGDRRAVPRAYIKRLEKVNPQLAEEIRFKSYRRVRELDSDRGDPARLAAGEVIALSRVSERSI